MFDNKSNMIKAAKKTTLSYLATYKPLQVQSFQDYINIFGEIKYYKIDIIHHQYQETVVWCDEKKHNFVIYEYGATFKGETLCHNTSAFSVGIFTSHEEFSNWCYSNKKDRIIRHINKKTLAKLYKALHTNLTVNKNIEKKLKKI